jgi:rhomboid protease GluP
LRDKINIIFIPTLLALLGLTVIYTFLNWILFIKLELFALKDIIANFVIPLILTGLTAWVLLRPRLKILRQETKKGNWREFYCFILWAVLTIPLIIAQEYLETASGRLTELTSVDEISNSAQTRFYTLENYFVDKKAAAVHTSFDASGKYNESLNMHIYVALPILARESDTIKRECEAWFGIEYQETISNRLDAQEKEKKYQEFSSRSQREFDKYDVSMFVYLDRIRNSDEKEGLLEAVRKTTVAKGDQIILMPVNEPFEARNGDKLEWIFGSALIGLSVWLLAILIPKTDEDYLKRTKAGTPDKKAQKIPAGLGAGPKTTKNSL